MRIPVRTLLVALAAGCGVPTETYVAKQTEAEKYRKAYEDETEKAADHARKIADLSARISLLEEEGRSLSERIQAAEVNLTAKQADLRATQERTAELEALVAQLGRSRAQLDQARRLLEARSAEHERLAGSLREEIESGRIEVSELRGRMTVKMADQVLFASGSAAVGRDGRAALRKIAEAFRGTKGRIVRVEGHTDDLPVAEGSPFPTNWELSTARALAVVRVLQEWGVDPTLLAACGYGEYQPVASNETADGRARNRRIEIVLAPPEGMVLAPAPIAAAPRPPRRAPAAARPPAKPAPAP